jgi:hypothetical protein
LFSRGACTNRRFLKAKVDEASKVGGSRVALTLSSKAKQVKVLQRHEEAIREAVDSALESGVVEPFFPAERYCPQPTFPSAQRKRIETW